MTKWQRMSEAEKQIMDIIWATGRPVTTSEIIHRLPEGKAWKQNTVITFLARLMDKDMITATRIGKANHYEPRITEQGYQNLETKQFIKEVHRGSASGLISALCDSGDLTKADIEQLMQKLKAQAEER
ncbi:BlaI/MecI/CopY family transcriptional regulator [Paenibacillus eucommiae]|uniref:Transcriptional regulator n=1 Tax=Paenibacillus eucommiae TaxID=1355755 RepID=A0ABS4IVK0_9BACL|nr:BlaI/MecI/CopY family transcriptional regulator [Paenibacillus eucommiae]MBP1991617.1 putative transcriptional regulator [Paenibacillus eucommiae]